MAGLLAVRIKDGIFVGNAVSSQDEEFLFLNKVSHIINCAATETPNLYQQAGINYLSFPWRDATTTTLFDPEDRNVAQIYQFIEKGLEKGECVLVHSRDGTSRCCAVVVAYLMLKFGWSLTNTLSFMITAHPDMAIQPYFIRQLKTYAKRHELEMDIFSPGVDTSRLPLDNEQWVLKNTYFNSLAYNAEQNVDLRKAVVHYESSGVNGQKKKKRITFIDTRATTDVVSTTSPVVAKPPENGRSCSPATPIMAKRNVANPHPLVTNWEEVPAQILSPAARQLLHHTPAPPPAPAGTAAPAAQPPASTTPGAVAAQAVPSLSLPSRLPEAQQPTMQQQLQQQQALKQQQLQQQLQQQQLQFQQQQQREQLLREQQQRMHQQLYQSSTSSPMNSPRGPAQESSSIQQPRQFADTTLPRPSPRPSLSASEEIPVPALSPAARRQAAAHNGEAAASLSALPSSPYYQAPPATVRQVNPNLRMQPQQPNGPASEGQRLAPGPSSSSAASAEPPGPALKSYVITNRNAVAGAAAPEKRPTSQQIINPNLLRNASAAQPTAPAADPGFSSSGAKRLAPRKLPTSPFVLSANQPRKGSPLPRRENRSPVAAQSATTGPGQRTDGRYNSSPLHERSGYSAYGASASLLTNAAVLRAQYINSPSRYDSPTRAYGSDAGESDDGKKGLKKRRPSRPRDSTPTGRQQSPQTPQPAAPGAAPVESRLMKPTASFLRKTTTRV